MDTNTANNGKSVDQPEVIVPQTQLLPIDKAVVDYISQLPKLPEKLVPEADKWKNLKEFDKLFSSAVRDLSASENILEEAVKTADELKKKIEKPEFIESLGDINMQGLRYIAALLGQKAKELNKEQFKTFVGEYLQICGAALASEEKSSEPVREQIFLNICNALNIPAYPLERLDRLYSDFKDSNKRKGIDMQEEMRRDLLDETEKQPGIKIYIEQQNTYWDSKRIQYVRKSPDEKEVVGREWDFWSTMTDQKFLLRQGRMKALKKLVDGEMTFENMKKKHEKFSEIRSWKID